VLLNVNGETRNVDAKPERSLLHVLREEMELLAAKPGCGEGACGACTVLLDGHPVRSCVRPIDQIGAGEVTTLEGLRDDAICRAVSDAFIEIGAFQCGFCTPGMIVAASALLREKRDPSDEDIVAALDGNVCRCGTYPRISRAVHQAAEWIGTDRSSRDPEAPARSDADSPSADSKFAAPAKTPWDLAAPEDRDYFDRLGDGLVVVLPTDEAARVNEVRGGAWSTDGGAWLHVNPGRRVTAFTGKVDIGQDNATALALLVAEELGVPVESVELVMGDTDFCPTDIGTFGSRSTEDAGGVLRAAAATARDWLSDQTTELTGKRAIVFAKGDVPTRDPRRWHTAGRPARRMSAARIVAGSTRYGSDLSLPGMLHGRVLRPPAWGAELVSVDLSAARAMSGVVALHEGDFVAVAAPDPLAAERALDAIHAKWREGSPPPSEAQLEEFLRAHPVEEEGWEGAFHHQSGDVEAALASSAISRSATYTTAYIAHVPLESRVAVAEWQDDRMTVWTGTQRPFGVRQEVADVLGIAEEQVRVIVPPTGSGYGGKHSAEAAVEAARLARASGRPVKVRWSRAEEFAWAYFRPAAVIDVRAGLDATGRLSAWQFRNINSGPFAIRTPYEVPNQRLEYQPADSPLRQGSYRGLAATANTFARESHMDELADAVGADPLEFRLRNLRDDRLAAVLRAAADGCGWRRTNSRAGWGMGIACSAEKGGRIATCVELDATDQNAIRLARIVTAFECGAIVDPDNLRNQVEGATVMGLGGALFEALHFADGRPANGSLSAYRVPRFSDIPRIEVVLIDRPDQPSAGAGETPIIAIAPAIANAIFAATGRRIRSMPLSPAAV
jgi:nicotinate dehydrogenase subunit B